MAELLLELFSEEIPARMQDEAERVLEASLAFLFHDNKFKPFPIINTFSTPRRLTADVRNLSEKLPDLNEERRGPKLGAPEKAIVGFSRGAGVDPKDLIKKDGYLFAKIQQRGAPTTEILAKALPGLIAKFNWRKSMRWGSGSIRWVRPLHSILCILDGEVIPFEVDGIKTGNFTFGHRFLAPGKIKVSSIKDYRENLRKAFVEIDHLERDGRIRYQARLKADEIKADPVYDDQLVEEVTGLVEWPVVLRGSFEKAFLGIPEEALISEMQHHQKYFPVRDPKTGRLMNKFIFVANMVTADKGKAIIRGNERVLSARLFDAKFFWDQDRKIKLEDRLPKLEGITFHEKLGPVGDRVDRIEKLAEKIAGFVPGCDPEKAKRAARLAKADLVSGMVGEFPELQGIMGYYYAKEHDEDDDIANAIRDQYSPKGPNDECPTSPVSVALALAENLEKLISFWSIGEKPTGSKDPFALRRAALSAIRLIVENELRIQLQISHNKLGVSEDLMSFLADRLKVQQKEKGTRHDLIDAVFSPGHEDDLVRLLSRVEALQNFLGTKDGKNLLAGYKRAVNILQIEEKKDGNRYSDRVNAKLLKEKEEIVLNDSLKLAEKTINQALAEEDFEGVMKAVAQLRGAIDDFFDKVTVNVKEQGLRENRLRLLAGIRLALLPVADFSKISG